MVTPADVVGDLAAHQSNLTPKDQSPRCALVALPTPAIVRALLGDAAADRRGAWIRSWSERLGGGDGPLPVVDLDDDVRPLDRVLRDLAAAGHERLDVIGARDQPGFARELACRWDGELRLDVAADAPDLDPDLATTLYAEKGSRLVVDGKELVAIDDDEDPADAVQRAEGHVCVFARDVARVAGAMHGFVPPSALFATERGNAVRARWLRHWTARGHGESVRDAVLGIDRLLEARLRTARVAAPTSRRARVFVVTGLDGSGKSSHAAALREALSAAGYTSRVLKLYRQGAFLALANELGARTRRGAPLAAFRVSRVVKLVDSLRVYRDELGPALDRYDAVLLDRYTETHRAAASSQLGWDLTRHPLLAPFPAADRTFWLRLDPGEALRRLQARGEPLSADEHPTGLAGYAHAFDATATRASDVVLDATAPFAENAERIRREALALLPSRGGGEIAEHGATTQPPARRSDRLPVLVGDDPDAFALGHDVADLATSLRRAIGDAADAVPTSFWIEAYAAQLVIDARSTGAARAAVALWPEALRRMRSFADLHVLAELSLLLDGAVRVVGFRHAAAHRLWSALVPSPAARQRLQAEYDEAVATIARERNWPTGRGARTIARVA